MEDDSVIIQYGVIVTVMLAMVVTVVKFIVGPEAIV